MCQTRSLGHLIVLHCRGVLKRCISEATRNHWPQIDKYSIKDLGRYHRGATLGLLRSILVTRMLTVSVAPIVEIMFPKKLADFIAGSSEVCNLSYICECLFV